MRRLMGSEYATPKYPLSHKDYFELKEIEIKKKKKPDTRKTLCPSLSTKDRMIFHHQRQQKMLISPEMASEESTEQTLLKNNILPSISFFHI